MSYFNDEERAKIKSEALENANRSLWDFIHSTLFDLVMSQGGVHQNRDGFFKFKGGEFDVNSGAEYIEIALETRAAFLQEKAENDKSG